MIVCYSVVVILSGQEEAMHAMRILSSCMYRDHCTEECTKSVHKYKHTYRYRIYTHTQTYKEVPQLRLPTVMVPQKYGQFMHDSDSQHATGRLV